MKGIGITYTDLKRRESILQADLRQVIKEEGAGTESERFWELRKKLDSVQIELYLRNKNRKSL
jgi:hypothetical protein